jgi:hypothetical protein
MMRLRIPRSRRKRNLVKVSPEKRGGASFYEMRTAVQVRQCFLISVLAAAATAVGIVVAPPAAADCVSGGGMSICSEGGGEVRATRPARPQTPYMPYDCDLDWTCDMGLSIALND